MFFIVYLSFLQLCLLDLVIKLRPEDSREAFTVRILLYKLFYDQTDQGMCQFILNLVRSFDTHKQPKRFGLSFCFFLFQNLEGMLYLAPSVICQFL